MTNWQTYCICEGKKKLRRLPSTADPEVEIGAAGGTALTAYCGLIYDGKPKANDTILISAAAGGTGLNAGFIAKAKFPNCTIVGTCGSYEKCQKLVKECGFDGAINYKKYGNNVRGFAKEIKEKCPNGVDVVFDNVGGTFLEAALRRINTGARIIICGAISNYQTNEPVGPSNYQAVAGKHATITGFTVYHYRDKLPLLRDELRELVKRGKMKNMVYVYEGLEKAPSALVGLYAGNNFGKVAVRIGVEEEDFVSSKL